MKKNFNYLIFLAMSFCVFANAKSQSLGCQIFIQSHFEATCLLTLTSDSGRVEVKKDDSFVACKESTVRYDAVCGQAVSYNWSVTEGTWSILNGSNGSSIVVTWSNADAGTVSVTITTDAGYTCSTIKEVALLELPQIASSSLPPYYLDDSQRKTIEVCKDEDIVFTDESSSTNTTIVSHYWESIYGTSAMPNYTIENIAQSTTVLHRVYNECGCFDEEIYEVSVLDGRPLELSCYGTVCKGAVVTYSPLDAQCNLYDWTVTGGTIVEGQGTPKLTVCWDNPQNNYGIVGLNGSHCEDFCDRIKYVKIPIISDNAEIVGESEVCENDLLSYSVPLWGNTYYHWTLTNANGAAVSSRHIRTYTRETPNELFLEFLQAGTYYLHLSYGCDFLNCGEYVSQTKIITVRPKLKIKGTYKICKGQETVFEVFNEFVDSLVLVAHWHIYDNANNQLLFVSSAQTTELVYTFNAVGKYRVTADRSDYCNTAEFIIEVKPTPATPTVQNVEGKHYTCPGTSLFLRGQNAPAGHTFVWKPANPNIATPTTFTANEVSIKYSDLSPEVCDVNVFFYNMDLGCESEVPYVHTVDEFDLAAVNLPEVIGACLYATIEFTQDNVFDQSPDVKYEWLITPEYAASVVGSHIENRVTIIVNNANVSSFDIVLKRKYCETLIETRSIQVNVVENPIAPMIIVENEECRFAFTVEPVIGSDEDYRWFIDNSNAGTGIEMHGDLSFGCHDIRLIYNPYPYCPADTNTIRVCAPDCNGTPPGGGGGGGSIHCSNELTLTIERNMLCPDNSVILKITNPNIIPPGYSLQWSATSINSYYANITGMSNYMAHVSFLRPGVYSISAMAINGTECITGDIQITVDCIPDFEVKFVCDNGNNGAFEVADNSLYLNPNLPTDRTFTVTRGSTTISANQPFIDRTGTTPTIANLLPTTGTYTYTITIRACGCTYTQTITLYPRITHATLHAINDYVPTNTNACGTVPILLSFSNIQPATTPITDNYLWDFGDNSTFKTEDPFIYHTFASTPNSIVFYTTMATITDINRCAFNKSIEIDVYDKTELGNDKLRVLDSAMCPGNAMKIQYENHLALPINSGTNQYYWEFSQNYNNSNIYNTYQTDDYNVLVVSHHGCIGQYLINVGFLNQPLALIVGKSDWCLYDEVALTGNVGNEVEYYWSVRDPWGDTVEVADSLPNITFKATMTGNYQIDLQVISLDNCFAETHSVITVHATPAAPSIDFAGNHCIHQPPVVLHSTNGTSLYWSSGVVSPVALYYVAGTALAYYYDADNGCKSADAAITIEPAPNFDGLLTGCYESCLDKGMASDYYIYNFMAPYATWRWLYNHTVALQSGTGDFNIMPLDIYGSGTYNLEVTYSNHPCVTMSPDLVINRVAECPCEVTITELFRDVHIEECRIIYKTGIEICNNGSEWLCFDRAHIQALIPDIHILWSTDVVINPGGCAIFEFAFTFTELLADMATFELTNRCGNCKVTVSVNTALRIEECGRMDIRWLECVPSLTNSNQLYYKFGLQLHDPAQRVLAIWSEPAQIINFYYNPNYGLVEGLSMFDWGDLSQLGEEGEVCFYVITCKDDHLCKYEVCVPVRMLIEQCAPFRRLLQEQAEEETNSSPVFLVPNPAVTTVEIKGLPPAQIADLLLLDITGRLVKTVKDTPILSVAEVAKGTYIVRVRDTNNQLYYLKLIKN